MESTAHVSQESKEKICKLVEEPENINPMRKDDRIKIFNNSGLIDQITVVRCVECGKLHDLDSKDYISFSGEVCMGMEDILIRENEIRCNTRQCLEQLLRILPICV